jgi:hypothetical protein
MGSPGLIDASRYNGREVLRVPRYFDSWRRNFMKRGFVLGLAMMASLFGVGPIRSQSQGISVQVVKYDGLKEAVRANRGKVVVVDFWGLA